MNEHGTYELATPPEHWDITHSATEARSSLLPMPTALMALRSYSHSYAGERQILRSSRCESLSTIAGGILVISMVPSSGFW